MARLTLVASYPKSGNTWMRAFLTSVLRDGAEISINNLMVPNAASREFIHYFLGISTTELTDADLATLRPAVYETCVQTIDATKTAFLKIHDAYLRSATGSRVTGVPAEHSQGRVRRTRPS